MKQYKLGKKTHIHSNTGNSHLVEKGEIARAWFNNYIDSIGDPHPALSFIYLPPMRKNDVYRHYKEIYDDGIEISTFYDIWKRHYQHVKLPQRQVLGKCTTCVTLKDQIESEVDEDKKFLLITERKEHIKFIQKERRSYYRRRDLGYQKEQVSIIIDGMDQKKTEIPFFFRETKDNEKRLKVRLLGCIVHGVGTYGFFLTNEFLTDANVTIECLWRTINLVGLNYFKNKTLYLQMDNCVKDNKNERCNFFSILFIFIQ